MIPRCRQWLVRVLSPADNRTELYRFEITAPTKRLAILNVSFGSEPECRAAFGHTIKVSPLHSKDRVTVSTLFNETLTPAYGRDYKSRKAILQDLRDGKDFQLQPSGRYCNRQDLEQAKVVSFKVRYARLTKVTVFKLAEVLQ